MTQGRSAHLDTFARDHLPPRELQPEYLFTLPELQFPPQLNCAAALLDGAIARGWGERPCILAPGLRWTYAELQARADAIAHVLVEDMGLVPGQRVLLRAPNNPMLAACWFGVMKTGAIAVATMPLLRAKELKQVVSKAQATHALCDLALAEELQLARPDCTTLAQVRLFNDASPEGLEAAMARHLGKPFTAVDTAADDTCLLAFTSGTTGVPKATMHFHQDVMAICACWPKHVLRAEASDTFIGSPPLGFTFGLGGLLLFPLSVGASTVLLEKPTPPALLDAITEHRASVLFTAPTTYRAIAAQAGERRLSAAQGGPLRKCVAAGEALPAATRKLWQDATGIAIIDGIGSTEMLHIFISADEEHARGGATGTAVPGYVACVLDERGQEAPRGQVGRLAVRGPTGCRYLDDERQASYVQHGWNLTGDAYLQDEDGYFRYQARTDDMIISAGYNIAAPEVEGVLLEHPAVAECAVIGVPDEERGEIVKAYVVLRAGHEANDTTVRALQDFVKASVAPYKYPRAVEFRSELPRTTTGKLQRFRLKV
ncbi:AMP-binding protein [Ideonella azotifigens]|uniref:AMP-binding protein n=3 Tax=Ideonella azotifigens TaxID=513160 RepID=A0ABN1JJF6_9BURK|nr:AMP-binding protein [Ideonella azotifigens]MCD2341958.1 AMP-binding protein [Ideonella azotifigens]